jgi:hypothetical protein
MVQPQATTMTVALIKMAITKVVAITALVAILLW